MPPMPSLALRTSTPPSLLVHGLLRPVGTLLLLLPWLTAPAHACLRAPCAPLLLPLPLSLVLDCQKLLILVMDVVNEGGEGLGPALLIHPILLVNDCEAQVLPEEADLSWRNNGAQDELEHGSLVIGP